MSGRATGGDLLAQALDGGGSYSMYGYRGPSASRAGRGSVEDMASRLYGRDKSDLFDGRWDASDSDVDLHSKTKSTSVGKDRYAVKVSGVRFFLRDFLSGLSSTGPASANQELLPKGTPQLGVVERPENFFQSGFGSVSGTAVRSVDKAKDAFSNKHIPAEDYGQYAKARDMEHALISARASKVAMLLVKAGFAAPAVPGAGYDDVPNRPGNQADDLDVARVAGITSAEPTHSPRRTRARNAPMKTAADSAASVGSAATSGEISTGSTKPPGEQKQLKFDPGKVLGSKKPRGKSIDALKIRPFTDGLQYDKVPRGFPELDPKFPAAKVARLLKVAGFCR